MVSFILSIFIVASFRCKDEARKVEDKEGLKPRPCSPFFNFAFGGLPTRHRAVLLLPFRMSLVSYYTRADRPSFAVLYQLAVSMCSSPCLPCRWSSRLFGKSYMMFKGPSDVV